MLKWAELLDVEAAVDYALNVQEENEITLYDPVRGYRPNPGGQARFWEEMGGFKEDNYEKSPYRTVALLGGVGCIAGETLIGGIPIKTLAESGSPFQIQTLAGTAWASHAFLKGRADLYRVRLASGREVLATKDHRFLTPSGWVRLADLRYGEYLAVDDSGYGRHDQQKSTDSQGSCSGDFRQGDALPNPSEVLRRDILRRLHEQPDLCRDMVYRPSMPCDSLRIESAQTPDEFQPLVFSSDKSLYKDEYCIFLPTLKSWHPQDIELSFHQGGASIDGYWDSVGSCQIQDSAHVFSGFCAKSPLKYLIPFAPLRSDRVCDSSQLLPAQKAFFEEEEGGCVDAKFEKSFFFQRRSNPKFPASFFLADADRKFADPFQFLNSSYLDYSKWDVVECVEFVRNDNFYDLHVPFWEHYSANGIIHHNSGKSYSGAVWACDKALKYPHAKGVVLANSYPQLAQATLVTLAEVCMNYNIPIDPVRDTPEETALAIINRRPSHCFLGPGRAYVYVLSTTSFEAGKQTSRGLQARWAWGDELAYSSETSFNTLDGRIGRGPGKDLPGSLCITTTPKGFNWLYYRFADPARSEEWKKTFWFVNCPTRENIEHLGADYVTSLEGNYSGDVGRQELEGLFLNTTLGLVYKWFNRQKHALQGDEAVVLQHNPGERLHLNLDFNASPGVSNLFHVRQQEVHCFKEFYQLDSDLWELMEQICEWLTKSKQKAEIWVHGDASGRARTATSKLSAWDIVKQNLDQTGIPYECKFPRANPPIVNRVDSFNYLCRNDRFFIDLDNCPKTLKDLETVTWDGEGIDKSDLLATHCSDALTYGTHWMFPFGGSNRKVQVGRKPVPGVT